LFAGSPIEAKVRAAETLAPGILATLGAALDYTDDDHATFEEVADQVSPGERAELQASVLAMSNILASRKAPYDQKTDPSMVTWSAFNLGTETGYCLGLAIGFLLAKATDGGAR
jgi:ribonuclease HI